MDETKTYKYSNMEFGTRIFFKGDTKDPCCLGTIIGEIPNGYIIDMDNDKTYIVHPVAFEEFGGLFQVVEERIAKMSWLSLN